jgi:YVTN family beta-propeller protein
VKTRRRTDIPVSSGAWAMAITPDSKTAFVANFGPFSSATLPTPESIGTVSVIDVKTRTKYATDITVGAQPISLAVTPDGKTVFVVNYGSDTVSAIDVKTRTKDPTDIPVGAAPGAVSVTPCRR